jgi:hypothetical protein
VNWAVWSTVELVSTVVLPPSVVELVLGWVELSPAGVVVLSTGVTAVPSSTGVKGCVELSAGTVELSVG